MDIVNWDALKKGLLIKNTLENPDDLVLVAANTTYKKRGDLFQTYAIPASALGGGGGGVSSLKSVVLQNDVAITTGSIVPGDLMDVTGLSFPVVAGKTYAFRFKAFFNIPNSSVGFSVSINGPTQTLLSFTSGATNNLSTAGFAPYNILYTSTYDAIPAAGSGQSTFAGINYAFIEGIVTASADGTIVLRAKKDSSNPALICTAKKGSYVEYSEVA